MGSAQNSRLEDMLAAFSPVKWNFMVTVDSVKCYTKVFRLELLNYYTILTETPRCQRSRTLEC